ncbi:glycosyltransferase [Sphingomonas sp. JC676]|uniref:glycosyltransferase family 2 protein n=1 Tax=Sphingomonas sp. JC676 TaxID=2768065 RepID=UPI0016580108|nr:glycosyltransferase [Sphingomonas sp. JC676]MBC9032459.1 glycosyltransferase [Sphingomonas sp. JC676]
MSDPTVSIIMATYNGAALLPETLASLRAQTLADWELIAVDDGSRDETVQVLRDFADPRVRVIVSETNHGPVIARNRAFAEARGRYIAGLDQDDIALPERFARQVAFLDAHDEAVLVSTAADFLIEGAVEPGNWPRPMPPALIDWLILIRNPLVWSSVMFRADAAHRLDPLERPELRYVEDFDLYHRLRPFGRLTQIDEVLTLYRCHALGASQVYNGIMRAHGEKLLTDRHHALLGEASADFAALLVRHVMACEPVSDRHALERLFAGIAALRADFEKGGTYSSTELAWVDREISRLWWRMCRAGIRSGTLRLHHALADRPSAVALGDGKPADLMVSQLIGGMRAIRRGLARS